MSICPLLRVHGRALTGSTAGLSSVIVRDDCCQSVGIAVRLLSAATFGGRLRFDHQRQRWLVWDRHRWTEDPDGEPWRLALRGTRLRYRDAEDLADADQRKRVARWAIDSESRARLDNALALARDLAPIADPGDQWDLDPWLLGCANGVLDLRTGVLRDGRWLWPTATWKDWDGVAMNGMKAIALVSTDRGQTWPEYLNVLDQYNRGVFSWEQSIVQLPDDRLLQVAWAYIEATGHHEPTPYTISADGRTFSAPRPTGLKGQTTKLHVLPDGTLLALYRRDDKPGLWANRCRIDGDDWVNLEEQLVWDGAPSGMAGEGRGADELVDLQFGFPQMVDLPSGGVFAVLWGQEDDVRNIRWFRIRVT